ncbi:MAG TPA: GPW/gp25 family protein [Pyrinomonadaceae bacterium]|jgi:phage baseplate assembly protein W|nr:GPW/gp25 family protein [Pyrinomonadaceae bacterium]
MPKDFLGRGWKFPVEVDATGKIALSEYEDDVREAIRIVLMTAKGERVMRPTFGAGLHDFVFASMSATTIGKIQQAVQDALLEWESRIELRAVEVEADRSETGKLLINVDYRVRATNTRFNLVFPFYLKEQA